MKKCAECGCKITAENKGDWSPYFCKPCDKERVERVSKQMAEIVKQMAEKTKQAGTNIS
jgi:hypothetical protein